MSDWAEKYEKMKQERLAKEQSNKNRNLGKTAFGDLVIFSVLDRVLKVSELAVRQEGVGWGVITDLQICFGVIQYRNFFLIFLKVEVERNVFLFQDLQSLIVNPRMKLGNSFARYRTKF